MTATIYACEDPVKHYGGHADPRTVAGDLVATFVREQAEISAMPIGDERSFRDHAFLIGWSECAMATLATLAGGK